MVDRDELSYKYGLKKKNSEIKAFPLHDLASIKKSNI